MVLRLCAQRASSRQYNRADREVRELRRQTSTRHDDPPAVVTTTRLPPACPNWRNLARFAPGLPTRRANLVRRYRKRREKDDKPCGAAPAIDLGDTRRRSAPSGFRWQARLGCRARRNEGTEPDLDLARAWRQRIASQDVQEDGREQDERVAQEGHRNAEVRVDEQQHVKE